MKKGSNINKKVVWITFSIIMITYRNESNNALRVQNHLFIGRMTVNVF